MCFESYEDADEVHNQFYSFLQSIPNTFGVFEKPLSTCQKSVNHFLSTLIISVSIFFVISNTNSFIIIIFLSLAECMLCVWHKVFGVSKLDTNKQWNKVFLSFLQFLPRRRINEQKRNVKEIYNADIELCCYPYPFILTQIQCGVVHKVPVPRFDSIQSVHNDSK